LVHREVPVFDKLFVKQSGLAYHKLGPFAAERKRFLRPW
jgi:hypothetical protein